MRTRATAIGEPDAYRTNNRITTTGFSYDVAGNLPDRAVPVQQPIEGRSPDEPFADQWEEDPQSWNLYSYVGNSPLSYSDPSGQVKCPEGTAPGDELAASVFTLNKLAYTQLHARGEAGLLEILQAVPEYWSQLQPLESKVRQLIREFIAWADQSEDDGKPDSDAAKTEKQ